MIVRTRTEAHFLRSQVGIGSESDCLLGKLRRIVETLDSVTGLKVEKLGGVVREVNDVEVGRGDADLRQSSLTYLVYSWRLCSVCVSVCLCICQSVCLSVSVRLSGCLSVYLSVCLCVCVCLFVCLAVRLSVCLSAGVVRNRNDKIRVGLVLDSSFHSYNSAEVILI